MPWSEVEPAGPDPASAPSGSGPGRAVPWGTSEADTDRFSCISPGTAQTGRTQCGYKSYVFMEGGDFLKTSPMFLKCCYKRNDPYSTHKNVFI